MFDEVIVSGGFLLVFELNLNIEVIVMSYQRWQWDHDRTKRDRSLSGMDGGKYADFKKTKHYTSCP